MFNDDKKTELIGETWVDLKDVVVPGGGQNDLWHSLNCKGKYAGEIRIEITYYDTRPKEEKPVAVRSAAVNGVDDGGGGRDSLKGPRQPKTAVKRRPLPSDPVTGAPAAVAIPDHVQNPPRGYPPSPTAVPDHSQTPPRGYQHPPPALPEHVQAPPRGYSQTQTSAGHEYTQTPPRGYQQPIAAPEHTQTPPRAHQASSAAPDQYQTPPRAYQNQPSAIPDHITPRRGSYIPNQSPLQSVEYSASQDFAPSRAYDESPRTNGYGSAPGTGMPSSRPIPNDRYDAYDSAPRNDYTQGNSLVRYGNDNNDIGRYDRQQSPYELPNPDEFGSPPSPEGPPPPPPAHRSTQNGHGSANVSPIPPRSSHSGYGFPSDADAYSTSPDHRNSMPAYSQNKLYQAYSPEKEYGQFRKSIGYDQSESRHPEYDSNYNDYGAMQPSVEDVPESPSGQGYSNNRDSLVRSSYEQVPSPAPLNLSGRGSSNSGRNSLTNAPSHQYSNSSNGYAASNSQGSLRDRAHTDASVTSRASYNSGMPQQDQRSRGHSQGQSPASVSYNAPPLPATLVSGMDPAIAQEIAERIYAEKQGYRGAGNSARGRFSDAPQYQPNQPKQIGYEESSAMVPFVSASQRHDDRDYQSVYSGDERQSRYSTSARDRQNSYSSSAVVPRGVSPDSRGTVVRRAVSPDPRGVVNRRGVSPDSRGTVVRRGVSPDPRGTVVRRGVSPDPRGNVGQRGVSPDPRGTVIRKSVSPSPGASDDTRRLSGIPFGPDSYNAFNPAVSSSVSAPSLSAAYNVKEVDHDAKIITHDGREIDPSDHIPESNYAPLLEQKGPKYASQQPDRNYRPPPSQPVSGTGRRQLQQRQSVARPLSMAASSSGISFGPPEPTTPQPGRNRLQKKSNRMSALPAPNSSPLAPITPYQDNSYVERSLPRGSNVDYNARENYNPHHGGSPGGGGGGGYRAAARPPIPAKVPMNMPQQSAGGADAWALLEEMKSIDLGPGRARRRGN